MIFTIPPAMGTHGFLHFEGLFHPFLLGVEKKPSFFNGFWGPRVEVDGATPISLGLSCPPTNRHLFGSGDRHLLSLRFSDMEHDPPICMIKMFW